MVESSREYGTGTASIVQACAVSALPYLRTIAGVFGNFEEIAQMVGIVGPFNVFRSAGE
jgi:hypothetical protein